MKTLRMIGLALVVVIASVGITSCSSDDDDEAFDENITASYFVGNWSQTTTYYDEGVKGHTRTYNATFKENGELIMFDDEEYTWKFENGTLTIYDAGRAENGTFILIDKNTFRYISGESWVTDCMFKRK